MPEVNDSVRPPANACEDVAHRLSREVYVLGAGTIGGALNETAKHPLKTIGETAAMGVAAVGLTAIASAELPVISVVAVGAGMVYGAGFVWNLVDPNSEHNVERNLAFRSAATTAWKTSEQCALDNSIHNLQDKSGADTLHLFEAFAVGGVAAKYGARTGEAIRSIPRGMPSALAFDGPLQPFFKSGVDAKVPTWDDYVYHVRRNGPITTKTMGQFELEKIVRASHEEKPFVNNARQNENAIPFSPGKAGTGGISHQGELKAASHESEPADGGRVNDKNSSEDKAEADSAPGNSLYFSQRYRRYQK